MKIEEFLHRKKENMPLWLKNYKKGNTVSLDEILASNTVYYPGAYFDGQPVATVNKSHFAHTFIYADYMVDKEKVIEEVTNYGFKGYHIIDCCEPFDNREFAVPGFDEFLEKHRRSRRTERGNSNESFFALLFVFERDEEYTDEHGCKRFALVYIGGDGIESYASLYGERQSAPSLLVLQDHGFGGNYDRFGSMGMLHLVSRMTKTYPCYILCASNTSVWHDYVEELEVEKVIGGMHGIERTLCVKIPDNNTLINFWMMYHNEV